MQIQNTEQNTPISPREFMRTCLDTLQKRALSRAWAGLSSNSFLILVWWHSARAVHAFIEHPQSPEEKPSEFEGSWYLRLAKRHLLSELRQPQSEWVYLVDRDSGELQPVSLGLRGAVHHRAALRAKDKSTSRTSIMPAPLAKIGLVKVLAEREVRALRAD